MWKVLTQIIRLHSSYFKFFYKWNAFIIAMDTERVINFEDDELDRKLPDCLIVRQQKGLFLYRLLKSIYYTYKYRDLALNSELQPEFQIMSNNIKGIKEKTATLGKSGMKISMYNDNMFFPLAGKIYISTNQYCARRLYELFNTEDYVMRDVIQELISKNMFFEDDSLNLTNDKGSVENVQ